MNNRIKSNRLCRICASVLALVLAISSCPMVVQGQESHVVTFAIDDGRYSAELQFVNDVLYCRADQWAQVAGCLYMINDENKNLYFYNGTPVILDSYTEQEYIMADNVPWMPFFEAAKQTGVCFDKIEAGTVCGYRTKPLAVFYHDIDRMFGISQYRIGELILSLGNTWVVASTAARGYAILSSLSIDGFIDAASGKMDQNIYTDIFLDILKTDDSLLGVITDSGKALKNPGKAINLLQKTLDDGGAAIELLKEMGFSESEIRNYVWSAAQGAYSSHYVNGLSDLYEAEKAANLLEFLELMDCMVTSVSADAGSIMAMQAAFADCDSSQIQHAVQKAIAARTSNKTVALGMYTFEYCEDLFVDSVIDSFEKAYEKSKGVTNLDKLKSEIFLHIYDNMLCLTEKANAIMYSEAYSQIQYELVDYYYNHRYGETPENAVIMHSVALLYLKSCFAAWELYEFDGSLTQALNNARTTISAEIINLMSYTEEELLQNGTTDECKQAIIMLIKDTNNSSQKPGGSLPQTDKEVTDSTEMWPTKQELFGGKCWRTTTGNVDAVHHAVTKFFGDGTYIGYSLITGTKFSGTYTYENGVLVYNNQIWDLEDTRNFKSRTLHSISPSGSEIYQEIFAGGEDDWNYYADKEQPDNSRKDWFVGTWKCRIQSDGETFVNEIGFAENSEVYIYDSIENGETFATIYGKWELIEQDGDLYYIELILPGTDENGTAIQFRTRITIEKQGQQAYIRHLSGQQTDIYYDCLFVRE